MRATDVAELAGGPPLQVARHNALRKAHAAARPGETVLGVDTLVTLDGEIYGKPADREHARATLERLSGRTHRVVSGLAVIDPAGVRAATAVTAVSFRALDAELLDWYLEREEWRERAGGYAIQGAGAALVRAIRGDYWNVVGLPLAALLELLPELLVRR